MTFQNETRLPLSKYLAPIGLTIGLFAVVVSTVTSAHAELIDNSETRIKTEVQAEEYYSQSFDEEYYSQSFDDAASWRVKPHFRLPSHIYSRLKTGTYTLSLKLFVDKQGEVDSISLVKSSGDQRLDQLIIRHMRVAKLNPFKKDGEAIAGTVIVPIQYEIVGAPELEGETDISNP